MVQGFPPLEPGKEKRQSYIVHLSFLFQTYFCFGFFVVFFFLSQFDAVSQIFIYVLCLYFPQLTLKFSKSTFFNIRKT